MTLLHWSPDEARLKRYSASSVSGAKGETVLRVELEITSPYQLAHLLEALAAIEADQNKQKPLATKRGSILQGAKVTAIGAPANRLFLTDQRSTE